MKTVAALFEIEKVISHEFSSIKKRNGIEVAFNYKKITDAILKAGRVTNEFEKYTAQLLTISVLNIASERKEGGIPTVEGIQDIVEEILFGSSYRRTAKAYSSYRDKRARIRNMENSFEIKVDDSVESVILSSVAKAMADSLRKAN
jgi:ribonucleoside-triphosphate reductase (formate)